MKAFFLRVRNNSELSKVVDNNLQSFLLDIIMCTKKRFLQQQVQDPMSTIV